MMQTPVRRDPDDRGYFGAFGGKYVPETLVEPVEELERAYAAVRHDETFQRELARCKSSTTPADAWPPSTASRTTSRVY